ncbi:DUF397 domain-containing protein [Saccharopolyspora flava]|uniref:DUF397 domain-containing protein n=1 Tax=Saccharopolyspora flava TaxID=95161 RepID=UPI000A9C91C2|nr:DUF397 domain-containing protein [Saccharopolyspora flava]
MNEVRNWRKSSYSGPNGECVEVARLSGHTAVRDSKHPAGGFVTATPSQWSAFVRALKLNRFAD